MKLPTKIDYIKILIFISFCFSLLISKYYLSHHDAFNLDKNGKIISLKEFHRLPEDY